MSDAWINRLVVSGPVDDVARFRDTVRDAYAKPPTWLSFAQLQSALPDAEREGLESPGEPWSDSVPDADSVDEPDEQLREGTGLLCVSYSFSLAGYEPDELLIRASRQFPSLCFVLGWVAPSNDEHRSRFIHNGYTLTFDASVKLVERIRSTAYRRYGLNYADAPEIDDDNALWADVEGDWALLDRVVAHWNGKVDRTLAHVSSR